MLEIEKVVEARVLYIAERPIPFTHFVNMENNLDVELIDGVMVEKSRVYLDHALCTGWLYPIIAIYVEERNLGLMLGSRIMVQIDDFGGRMPNLLFVRQDRMAIIQQKAVYGAPDLVIEIVSPNDRPSDLRALEADYQRLGVPEMVFVDLRKQEIRLLRKRDDDYEETIVRSGSVDLESIVGLTLQAEWILQEPRPGVRTTLNALLASE